MLPMNRKMSVAFVGSCALIAASQARAADWFVPGDAATIQEVIDTMASGGDTIFVGPGTYGPLNFENLNLRIVATAGPTLTTIDAAGAGAAVVVDGIQNANSTFLDGFTVTGGTGGQVTRGADGPGGGVFISNAGITVQNCIITDNIATVGGGISAASAIGARILNCEITNNVATGNGGGVSISFGALTLINCTIANNIASSGGGVHVNDDLSGVTLSNCIVWDNAGGGVVLNDQNPGNLQEPTLSASYSNIQGTGGAPGNGNIDADPDFVSGANLRLNAGSPCIDAANSQLIDSFLEDVGGEPRGVNDPATVDSGVASLGLVVDMGCYELQAGCEPTAPCPGDSNSDNVVNLADLLEVLSNWGLICP